MILLMIIGFTLFLFDNSLILKIMFPAMEKSDSLFLSTTTDFNSLFEFVNGMYLALLPDLTVVNASNAYLASVRKTLPQITGKYVFDIFLDKVKDHVSNSDDIHASLLWVLKNRQQYRIAVRKRDARLDDGTFLERYWWITNTPVFNSLYEISYIIHQVEDSTAIQKHTTGKDGKMPDAAGAGYTSFSFSDVERLRKENVALELKLIGLSLQMSDAIKNSFDYRRALDESCIVTVTDEKGTIQHANGNFCKISKYAEQELIGQDHRIVNSGYHSKEFMRGLWETIANGGIWRGELKNRAKDGSHYWVYTTIVPFLDNKRKPYRYLAIRSDITEQKLSGEMIRIKKRKYYDLFENSLVPMFISDPETRKPINVNDVGFEFFGYSSRKDFIDNYDPFFHFMDPVDFENMRKDVIQEGIAKRDNVKMRKRDGGVFSARMVSKLSADKCFVQTALIDVTDQVRSQQDLEALVQERTMELTNSLLREKELNELKTRFVAFASHEFRTPLSSILSSASLIEMYRDEGKQEEREKHTQRIMASVNELKNILDEFLSFMRLEKGTIDTDKTLFSLPEFFRELVDECQGMINIKKQTVEFSHDGKETVFQSKKILRHILLNLLSNANKYSMENTVIRLHSSLANGRIIIAVKDQGIGIPENDQPKLFTEFFRAGNVENIQGTGLGLSIVKKYTELLNGSIDFVSKPGDGTTFSLQLPADS